MKWEQLEIPGMPVTEPVSDRGNRVFRILFLDEYGREIPREEQAVDQDQ